MQIIDKDKGSMVYGYKNGTARLKAQFTCALCACCEIAFFFIKKTLRGPNIGVLRT